MDCRTCRWYYLCSNCRPIDQDESFIWGAITSTADYISAKEPIKSSSDDPARSIGMSKENAGELGPANDRQRHDIAVHGSTTGGDTALQATVQQRALTPPYSAGSGTVRY